VLPHFFKRERRHQLLEPAAPLEHQLLLSVWADIAFDRIRPPVGFSRVALILKLLPAARAEEECHRLHLRVHLHRSSARETFNIFLLH